MPKVIAVAHSDLCLGFSLAGVECVPCVNRDGALEAIGNAIASSDTGIVIVEEELLEGTDPHLRREFLKRARPLIVPLPGALIWKDTEERPSDDLVARLVRQAVGYRLNIKL
ncbi:MAG: V-type ATP synthase subunit F [Treponemataceae bacterium]